MLHGSSSTTKIFGQHLLACLYSNIVKGLERITIGESCSSKSSIYISLFSRMNENVEPFPSSDVTEIPFEVSGPNF